MSFLTMKIDKASIYIRCNLDMILIAPILQSLIQGVGAGLTLAADTMRTGMASADAKALKDMRLLTTVLPLSSFVHLF